jgi:hypothetical protein
MTTAQRKESSMWRAGTIAVGLLAGMTLAPAAWAATVPAGPVFTATSCTNCHEESPAIAGAPSGTFLTAWEGTTANDPRAVTGRFFTINGTPRGTDTALPTGGTPDQYDVAATTDTAGSYVVVWSSVTNGNSDIFARKFKATGVPVGAVIQVSQDAAGTPTIPADANPAVAATRDGGFVVAWISLLPASATFNGTDPSVLARKFNSTGAPAGPQVKLSTGLVHGSQPDVCVDTAGGPVVVWTSVDAFRPFQSNYKGVSLRRLTTTGALTGAAETIVANPLASTSKASVACGTGGTFLVAWSTDLSVGGNRSDVVGQRYSRLGRKTGPLFRINGEVNGDQSSPSVIFDSNATFTAVWQFNIGTREGISGRRFTAAAVAQGADFEIYGENEDSSAPERPDLAAAGAAGRFVVVWQEGALTIKGRRFLNQ